MSQVRFVEIGDLFLVANDVNQALERLPEDLRRDIAPLVRRMGVWRLATIQGGTAHPTALLMAFSQFLEMVVDEYGQR
jgi:hypothetical protein